MVSYHVRGILADPGQVIPVKEELTLTEIVLGKEHIPFLGPCRVEGKISNVGNEILRFDGQAAARIGMRCARCNKPVEVPLNVEISQRFAKEEANVDSSYNEEDIELITNDHIDLENVIFHEIQLSIPMRALCKEDCKGLCPVCGQDLNEKSCRCETKETDPRWDALKGLFDE